MLQKRVDDTSFGYGVVCGISNVSCVIVLVHDFLDANDNRDT